MDDTKKMFQTIINGQSALKQELLSEIRKVDGKLGGLENKVDNLQSEMKQEFKKLTERVDKIGLQVAHLEDDAPTVDEFDDLVKRVKKLESQILKN